MHGRIIRGCDTRGRGTSDLPSLKRTRHAAPQIVRTLAIIGGLTWAGFATIPFIGSAVPQQRKGLAVYPVLLLYASLGWMALVKNK